MTPPQPSKEARECAEKIIGTHVSSWDGCACYDCVLARDKARAAHEEKVMVAAQLIQSLLDEREKGARELLERAMCCLRLTVYENTMAPEIDVFLKKSGAR